MSKRSARKQLTMDNYDEDDEEVDDSDDGPQLASTDVLKTRPIIKAKRRSDLNSPSTDVQTKTTAFSGFGGFKGFNTNSLQNSSSLSAFKSMTQMETNDRQLTTSSGPLTQTNGNLFVGQQKSAEELEDLYHEKLNELNKCFVNHINGYTNKSFAYDFTQVCEEYIKYHKNIANETKIDAKSEPNITISTSATILSTLLPKPTLSFGTDSQTSAESGFGSQISFKTTSPTSQSPFSSQTSSSLQLSSQSSAPSESTFAMPKPQFGFGADKPFSINFGTGSTGGTGSSSSSTTTTEKTNDEESDEPPKVESIEHKEPNCLYSKKCKLFFQKDNEWPTKGIGFLYIKKEPTATSAQLLIRADNKLGNILLHIQLNDSLPINKAKDNNGVLLSCIPNPPVDPKAKSESTVSFLIKVKKGDNDELYNNLIKYKSNN